MPELALDSFVQSSEIGQLPNISKSATGFHMNVDSTERQDTLFTAILKALVLLDNEPSFPREIADCIVKYKLASLGESNPCTAVTDCIGKYFEHTSEHYSSDSMLLLKIEDHRKPGVAKYYLPHTSGLLSPSDESSSPYLPSNKRASLTVDLPSKKIRFNKQDEELVPLPFEGDWLSVSTQSANVETFDQCLDSFAFDTIVPISYETLSASLALQSSNEISYDSDASNGDLSDTDLKSYLESIDGESEADIFCEDIISGDPDFNLSSSINISSVEHELVNEFSISFSDHDSHSDSSHCSTESGTSTTSPLLTPEPSPRGDSGMAEKVFTNEPSVYGESFMEHWGNHDSPMNISTDNIRESRSETNLADDVLQISKSQEFKEIGVGYLANLDALSTKCPPINAIDQTVSAVFKHDSTLKTAWSKGSISDDGVDGNLVPCIEDQVSSFLHLDEEDEKLMLSSTSKVCKETIGNLPNKSHSQPNPVYLPKTTMRNSKSKNRITDTSEYNPSMLIASVFPLPLQISITMVESLPFYIATVGPAEGFSDTYQLLRRYDSGYVNATTLLTAGGMESGKEQAIVLSLEIRRMRIRRQESPLFGTWIPLQRARALAATCSLQQKLGPFLDYDLSSYFPSQLPPHIAAFNPDQVSTRLHQFIRTRAASLKSRDNYAANIGIAPRCLHPTSKSFFSGVGHQLNQILGLQSKQLKSHSALEETVNPRRPSKSKSNLNQIDEYVIGAEDNQVTLTLTNVGDMGTFIDDTDFGPNEREIDGEFLKVSSEC